MAASARAKLVGPGLLIFGLVFVAWGFQDRSTAARLKEEGVNVPGQVVGHEIQRGRRGSKTYKLVATYTPKSGGQGIQAEFKVPQAKYEATQDGEAVQVRHLPSDPSVAELVGAESDPNEKIFVGGIMGVIGLVVCLFVFRKGG
jgi:hypothetical protein